MKNSIAPLLLFLISVSGISQTLSVDFSRNNKFLLQTEKLHDAKRISDVIPDYPSLWIVSTGSTEVTAICKGKSMVAISASDTLSAEQKNILNMADMGTLIRINMSYSAKNPVMNSLHTNVMHFSAIATPEKEAEYPGGFDQMKIYLKENTISKISETDLKKFTYVRVRFSINEEGEISNAKTFDTAEDQKIRQLIIDAVNKMPKWSPAENANGVKIKQEFEFTVGGGNRGGC